MQPDSKALAEAKALINCIQVTDDPTEQNRLWNRYYRLSDRVFPETAALHQRYKSLSGAERQRFKQEYMELVRRMWAATHPEAALSFSIGNSPPPRPTAAAPRRAASRKAQASKRRSFSPLALVIVVVFLAVCGTYWWRTYQGKESPAFVNEPPVAQVERTAPMETSVEAVANRAEITLPVEDEKEKEAAIDAELARTILPEFKSLPNALRGKGDRVVAGSQVYDDVYVIESASQYFVRIPEEASVETFDKTEATVVLGSDPEDRKAVLALWYDNQGAIEAAQARRETEKNVRLASYYKAQEKLREERKLAQDRERWRVKGQDWRNLTVEQRQTARLEAYSNWQGVQIEVRTLEELYYNISKAYELIGISDSRLSRLAKANRQLARERGASLELEGALISYEFDRDEILREVGSWEEEYYRLLDEVNEVYDDYAARVEEIKQLDNLLPSAMRDAEAITDWDKPLDNEQGAIGSSGGVGTGFVVSEGYVMTCAHVVRGGTSITATSTAGIDYTAEVVTMDTANDWALLKVEGLTGAPIPVATGKPNVGATIYCLGYPLGGIKDSADPIVGSGNIAALQRLDGDRRFMQITAPVNPGNSGGPVLDQKGRWVGMVSQKMNDQKTLDAAQTVAQGINFAVKASVIQPIIDPRKGVKLATFKGDAKVPMSLEKIAATLAPSIVRITVQ